MFWPKPSRRWQPSKTGIFRSTKFIIVATGLPDYGKWLDGLEAGANDYCCMSQNAENLGWMLLPEAQFMSSEPLLQQKRVPGSKELQWVSSSGELPEEKKILTDSQSKNRFLAGSAIAV